MTHTPLLKVYGHIYPADDALYTSVAQACACAMPDSDDVPVVEKDGDMIRVSFEGVYFPVEEVLACLAQRILPCHQGKLDVLDLENWQMTRHLFQEGRIQSRTVPLNHVLAYSGH